MRRTPESYLRDCSTDVDALDVKLSMASNELLQHYAKERTFRGARARRALGSALAAAAALSAPHTHAETA
jgi:hypothetical protein